MEELLQKIILKVYQLNKDTKHSVFLEFYGHTNELQVSYYKDGWKLCENPSYRKEISLDEENTSIELEQILKDLNEL